MGFGGGNSAVQAASAQQAAQQAAIEQATKQITNAYSGPNRQAQYGDYQKNLENYYSGQVNNQEAINARNLKFANARSGLSGGSAAIDSNTQLQKDYSNALVQASQAAQTGTSALRQADVNSENQLIGLAQQGNYTGELPTLISQGQNASLSAARANMNPNALGSMFTNTANLYSAEQTAAANRKAQYGPLGSLYG